LIWIPPFIIILGGAFPLETPCEILDVGDAVTSGSNPGKLVKVIRFSPPIYKRMLLAPIKLLGLIVYPNCSEFNRRYVPSARNLVEILLPFEVKRGSGFTASVFSGVQ